MPPCGSISTPTPLLRYAASLEVREALAEADPLCQFPMYTVSLETLLKMTEVESHESLRAQGMLIEFKRDLGNAAFVSHQWVGSTHPDPEFKQMRVLQSALKHATSDAVKQICVDAVTAVIMPSAKNLPGSKLRSKPLFIWYDYFSVPQLDASKSKPGLRQKSNLSRAIDSIPAYVGKCSFFFALCPTLENPEHTRLLSPATWAERGWCRLERAARELGEDASWIMIRRSGCMDAVGCSRVWVSCIDWEVFEHFEKRCFNSSQQPWFPWNLMIWLVGCLKVWNHRKWSILPTLTRNPTDLELMVVPAVCPIATLGGRPSGEGDFSFEEDWAKLGPLLAQAVHRKLLLLLESRDFVGYRFLLNLQSVYLRGFAERNLCQPIPGFQVHFDDLRNSHDSSSASLPSGRLSQRQELLVAKFLYQNGFMRVNEWDNAGWSVLHYAALQGDPSLIQDLLAQKLDPNSLTKKDQPQVGLPPWITALTIAVCFKHNTAARLLISARARIDAGLFKPLEFAATGDNPEGEAWSKEARHLKTQKQHACSACVSRNLLVWSLSM